MRDEVVEQADAEAADLPAAVPDSSDTEAAKSVNRWFVAETLPRNEEKASFNLLRQNYKIYLPRYLKTRRHARKTDEVLAPLFPNYVFIALDTRVQEWRPINGTFGVKRLVTHGGLPAAVPTGVVEGLKAREVQAGVVTLEEPPPFKPGTPLRVLEGPFADHTVIFRGLDDRRRVQVLLSLLGRPVGITLDAAAVEAAG